MAGTASTVLLVLDLLDQGLLVGQRLANIRAETQRFVDEGREPTGDEWAGLFADTDASTARLHDAAEKDRATD